MASELGVLTNESIWGGAKTTAALTWTETEKWREKKIEEDVDFL